jgi:hypothetical protein
MVILEPFELSRLLKTQPEEKGAALRWIDFSATC